jgi:hypothetical protein
MKNTYAIVGIAVVVVGGIILFLKSTTGQAIGEQAAGVVTGFVGGVGGSVADAANNPDVNPLYDIGSSLGATIFDLFHPGYESATP